jgi:Family of unknown function (DUF6166)
MAVQTVTQQMNLHSGFSLSKIHRYVLDLPAEPAEANGLYLDRDALVCFVWTTRCMPTRPVPLPRATAKQPHAQAISSWITWKASRVKSCRCEPMKTYEGKRTIDGLVGTVDGKRLDEHYDVKRFTEYGFEWAYEGASPQQLALAILFDYLGDKERSMQFSEPFMKTIIANLDNEWTLDNYEIDSLLRANAA